MQSIEYNKENCPILNQIYDVIAELQEQNKNITLCKVPAHGRIKGNKGGDEAAKETMDTPRVTTTRLLYTDYYLTNRKLLNRKGSGKMIVANYTTSNQVLKSGRVPTIVIIYMRLS